MIHSCSSQKERFERVAYMGAPVSSSGLTHLISAAVGFLASQWSSDQQALIRAVREAGQVAETRCLEGARQSFECPQNINNSYRADWKIYFSVTLLSVGGLFCLLCWVACRRATRQQTPALERDSDSSPDSLEGRKRLAHLQLAEIRARGRRHGTGQ